MAKGLISIMVIKVKELNMVVQIRLDSLGFSFVIKKYLRLLENKCKYIMYELLFIKKKF